ncbi:MAG: tagatose 1,6-diphosphate aldolase [Chloroflexota bacterium]
MSLSVGKLRGLQQCSTPDDLFVIMALDHRNVLQTALNPSNPDSISYSEMAIFKTEVTRALSPVSSAVLLDPEYGAAQAIAANAISGSCGLMVSLEETGYTDKPSTRKTQILPDWSVEQVARIGASAAKLMLYYHPEAKNAEAQEMLVREVANMCRQYDLAFFLQPLSYSLDSSKKLSSAEKRAIVVETARRLSPLGIDILKTEFPVDIDEVTDEGEWADACTELNEASATPWVLLSAGMDFDRFLRQTEVACKAGAGGVMAGRAVWWEAVELRGDAQMDFLYKTAIDRIVALGDVISEYGTPWTDYYSSSITDIPVDWYESY